MKVPCIGAIPNKSIDKEVKMETQQKYVEIRRIFNEVIEEEVRRYLNRKAVSPSTELDFPKSKIEFCNARGDMIFLGYKYKLLGIGYVDSFNPVTMQIDGTNSEQLAPTFIIQGFNNERCLFYLHLELPEIQHEDNSYFIKEPRNIGKSSRLPIIYDLHGKEMLESEDFKKCILEMICDLAPERLSEVQQLFA